MQTVNQHITKRVSLEIVVNLVKFTVFAKHEKNKAASRF